MYATLTAKVLLPWLTLLWSTSILAASERTLRIRSAPDSEAETVAEVKECDGIEILQFVEGWAEIRRGEILGWAEVDNLLDGLRSDQERIQLEGFYFYAAPTEPGSVENPLADLLDFSLGDAEQEQKMTDPHYRHAVTEVSNEWGPLFRYKTPYYSRRGIHLLELWKERIRLNLVKGKENYTETFGPAWSGEFQDRIVESNRGILSNRGLFGRGRSFFLELRYSF